MATKGTKKAKDLLDQVEDDVDAGRPVDAEVDAPAPDPTDQANADLATGERSHPPGTDA